MSVQQLRYISWERIITENDPTRGPERAFRSPNLSAFHAELGRQHLQPLSHTRSISLFAVSKRRELSSGEGDHRLRPLTSVHSA